MIRLTYLKLKALTRKSDTYCIIDSITDESIITGNEFINNSLK